MIKSNFCSEVLLCNCSVTIIGKRNETYLMKLPILQDKLENIDYETFINFCAVPLEEVSKKSGINISNRLALFKIYQEHKKDVIKTLNKFFEKYMIGFKYVDDSLYWGNRLVGKEIFETFCDYCAIAAGKKSIKDLDLIITDDMDEFEKRRIEAERRIAKTKAKGKEDGKDLDLSIVLSAVSHEFSLSFQQLLNMTLYSIYFMYSELGPITSYTIANIAAGNGLLKRSSVHKHWGQTQ